MSTPGEVTAAADSKLDTGGLIGLAVVASLVPLNSTMIAVALPDVADDFDIASGRAGLLVTIYLVVMLVGQPTAGRLIDRVGAGRAMRWCLIGFTAASVATAMMGDFALVVVGRAVQAVFGAALMPSSQAILRAETAPASRGRAFGLMGSFIGTGAAAGPLLGGVVTALAGWQGVFLVNVPIVALALTGVARVTGTPIAGQRTGPTDRLRHVLTTRTYTAAFLTQSTTTFGQYSMLLAIPMVLDARGWGSGRVGAALVTLTAGMVLMGPVGGRAGDRRGRRWPVVTGVALATAAMVLATAMVESGWVGLVIAMTVFGFGLGFAVPSVQTAALESVPTHFAGSAAGVLSMSRYTGSIPASVLLAALVSDGGDGAMTLLTVASVAMAVALWAASRLPSRTPTERGEAGRADNSGTGLR